MTLHCRCGRNTPTTVSPTSTEVAARASQAGKACQAAGATQNGGGSRQQLVLQRAVTVEESYEQAYDYERRRYGGNRGSALRLIPHIIYHHHRWDATRKYRADADDAHATTCIIPYALYWRDV